MVWFFYTYVYVLDTVYCKQIFGFWFSHTRPNTAQVNSCVMDLRRQSSELSLSQARTRLEVESVECDSDAVCWHPRGFSRG